MKHNILYKVTGRYMDGQKVIGYHLVGNDGSQLKEGKDRIIFLIGKGLIVNMRIQTNSDGGIIIRGKGVNLNELPAYNVSNDTYRNKNNKTSKFGQYTITKRIMNKSNCIGYEVVDYSGKRLRKRRAELIDLVKQRLITNATVQTYQNGYILRGVGCDLNKLPVLIVDNTGNIVDPLKYKNISVRSAYMKNAGVIHDYSNNSKLTFKAGDFVVYSAGGIISILSSSDIEKAYKKSNITKAVCDDYLELSNRYGIEIFGKPVINLNADIVSKWVVLVKGDIK